MAIKTEWDNVHKNFQVPQPGIEPGASVTVPPTQIDYCGLVHKRRLLLKML